MKVRIVQGGIGSYEVEYKQYWLSGWSTVYDGCLPFRGTYSQAVEVANAIRNKFQ